MDKESLTKAKELIIDALDGSDIAPIDKLELIINLNMLLSEKNYEEDIQTLKEKKKVK